MTFALNFRVTFPEKLKTPVDADSQQKLVIRFLLKDVGTKKAIRVHQAFVRLSSATNEKSGQEIIFVAEPDSSNVYKFDMVRNFSMIRIIFYLFYC